MQKITQIVTAAVVLTIGASANMSIINLVEAKTGCTYQEGLYTETPMTKNELSIWEVSIKGRFLDRVRTAHPKATIYPRDIRKTNIRMNLPK